MRTERLRHLAEIRTSNVDKKSVDGDTEVRLCNYVDVYYHPTITNDLPFMVATASREQIEAFSLRRDDVLFTKDSETADDIGIAAHVPDALPGVVCGYHLAVARPRRGVDGRFLFWSLHSHLARDQFTVAATGVTRFGLRGDAIGDLRLPAPPLTAQRAIAKMLDAETARIDALTAKKRRMIELADAWKAALIEDAIRDLARRSTPKPLKRAAGRIEVGIVITPASWYAEVGVLALRGINVRPGRLLLEDTVNISEEGHRLHRKSELREGDVVVVRTGQAGAAAVIPAALQGCNCIDLVIVRRATDLVPRYLEYVLNSDWSRKHIDAYSVGTIQSHFNVGAMKELPVPVPSIQEQEDTIAHLDGCVGRVERLRDVLSLQLDLLVEHRQALITAAVTGELAVPGVAA